MARVQQIDHTADVGLQVEAGSLEELFTASAYAMFEVIADLDNVRNQLAIRVHLQAQDVESLFVKWLSELNYRHITEEMLFCQFKIRELDETHISASAWGEPIRAEHIIHTEIKAITYHHLKIEQRGTNWYAQFIFDM